MEVIKNILSYFLQALYKSYRKYIEKEKEGPKLSNTLILVK